MDEILQTATEYPNTKEDLVKVLQNLGGLALAGQANLIYDDRVSDLENGIKWNISEFNELKNAIGVKLDKTTQLGFLNKNNCR